MARKEAKLFPRSLKLLESLVETNDEYITRKLRWLFANEKRHLIKLKDWQIQRKIGIRKLTPQILSLINTERYRALQNYFWLAKGSQSRLDHYPTFSIGARKHQSTQILYVQQIKPLSPKNYHLSSFHTYDREESMQMGTLLIRLKALS